MIKTAPTLDKDQIIVMSLSGRGDKDVELVKNVTEEGNTDD